MSVEKKIITEEVLSEWEVLLTKGHRKLVLNALADHSPKVESQNLLLKLSSVYRRAGAPLTALKLLGAVAEAPAEIKIERARSFLELKAAQEALTELEGVSEGDFPIVSLLRGQSAALNWDFQSVISDLSNFISHNKFHLETDEARKLLLAAYRIMGQFSLALAISHELPLRHNQRRITELVNNAFLSPKNPHHVEALKEARMLARMEDNGELERELDFYIAALTQDAALFNKLYYGTPSRAFRERLRQTMQSPSMLLDQYPLMANALGTLTHHLNLRTGTSSSPEAGLKVGQKVHRVFASLCRDFYTGISIPQIAEQAFLGERFNPIGTPPRIHQLIKRLKLWFKTNQIPISIIERKGAYTLAIEPDYGVIIPHECLNESKADPLLVRLNILVPGSSFTVSDAAKALGLSKRFARKLLRKANGKGYLKTEGSGKYTRYMHAS